MKSCTNKHRLLLLVHHSIAPPILPLELLGVTTPRTVAGPTKSDPKGPRTFLWNWGAPRARGAINTTEACIGQHICVKIHIVYRRYFKKEASVIGNMYMSVVVTIHSTWLGSLLPYPRCQSTASPKVLTSHLLMLMRAHICDNITISSISPPTL